MQQPLVSILYPVYNVEPYVDDAIRSVLAQSVPNWELIACDDASTDRTLEKLRQYSIVDARVRVIENAQNVGMTRNWNRALASARGEFVVKLDGDDCYLPETLARLLAAIRGDSSIVGAGVRTLQTDENLQPIEGLPAEKDLERSGIDPRADHLRRNEEWLRIAVHGTQLWHSCAFMVRRTTLEQVGGFDERFGCASDTELLLRLLALPGSFAYLAYPGVLYRRVAGSVSDVFRKHGWLRWEGTVANLLAMSKLPTASFSRQEWRTYLNLWLSRQELEGRADLAEFRERTLSYLEGVSAPPWWRLTLWRARIAVSNLLRRRDSV